MHKLLWITLLLPTLAIAANKVVTFTITPDYALSLPDAQLICNALYSGLSTEALSHIERLQGTPYSCKLETNAQTSKKELTIVFSVI